MTQTEALLYTYNELMSIKDQPFVRWYYHPKETAELSKKLDEVRQVIELNKVINS